MDQKITAIEQLALMLGTAELSGLILISFDGNGNLTITPTITIPPGGSKGRFSQLAAGISILAEMFSELVARGEDALPDDMARLFSWTPSEGLMEIPLEEFKLLMSARHTA